MKRTIATLSILTTLILAGGCDKAENAAKADSKSEKTAAKADAKDEKAEPEAAAARVEAGGKIAIQVDATGYTPAEISAPANAKITLAFKRISEAGCGDEVVIKGTEIKKQLPVGEVVEIEIQTPAKGEVGFACGMDMYQGKVVVKG